MIKPPVPTLNIFILSEDPVEAAQQQCNKHICKMLVESAQLLSTAIPKEIASYKHTHFNHPCARWVRESLTNYRWLLVHADALCEEYTKRFHKIHKTEAIIHAYLDYTPAIPKIGLTPFARAIKQPWKDQSANMSIVDAYRYFYIGDKARFAKWAPRSTCPSWWPYEDGVNLKSLIV